MLGTRRSLMEPLVNQQFTNQADKLFMDYLMAGNFQAFAEQSVAATKELYAKTATAAQDGTKALTEIADTAWGSTKMLNEKAAQNLQNLTSNFEVTFAAAHAIAAAKSLPEIAKLQSDFLQKFTAQATEQTKEFVDLSTRASQHVFERVQAATAKSFKATV